MNMNPPMETSQRADLRDLLAAERTFLAWIRTGLALMGFGFVVARFGLFLQQLQIIQHAVLVNVASAWHHLRLVRELDRGGPIPSRPSIQAVLVAVFLALVGLAMAIYLISVRGTANFHSENSSEAHMATTTDKGIVDKPGNHSVEQTVDRLKDILQSKEVTLFALVDHSGEAEKAGMKMRPTKLLIFGNPKAGTPLMLAAPSSAIDLPLKILVWEDDRGKVWLSYNSPEYLQKRHGLPENLLANISIVEALATKAGE
jgi:uncharacterized protein (DUF302 family)/uncharacterized membrane protein YidH (DUF202 family)